jgi:hypothetical protein
MFHFFISAAQLTPVSCLVAMTPSHGRLLRQFMTEGVPSSVAGGSLGLVFAHLGVQALIHAISGKHSRANDVGADRHILFSQRNVRENVLESSKSARTPFAANGPEFASLPANHP